MSRYSKRNAFTLIEVVITLLIVVLIASFGIGKYSKVQEDSRINIDIAGARQIGDAAELALVENPSLTATELEKAVIDRIKLPVPVSKKYKADNFVITVGTDGSPKVTANGLELYPNVDKTTN